ncbi:unnamed protein product [Trypanosoma congolense IL3000]|uniref:WGS project CAEQ00000000 data, annotated contig 2031 n=1 Tax=Trypanosoma congolense (strain IL3000) TaxID=1068625 RepID=F9WAY2_TRYCI|nr:unnamed protein product [Trypanosoma congolense IL3000]
MVALMKSRDEHESKYFDWKLHFHASHECEMNESVLEEIRIMLENVNTEFRTLPSKAVRARALAANSTGRLDEFITVFANAKGDSKYCLGDGNAAKPENLRDCFNKDDFGEESLVDISERLSKQEPNLDSKIEGIKHQSLKDSFADWSSAGCNLIKGAKEGILKSTNLEESLWCGGGILTIGKAFQGVFNSENVGAGENASNTKEGKHALWTADPATKIVHLKNASDAFKAFKTVQQAIQAKVKSIEEKIESCMGGPESGENNTEQNITEPAAT